MQPDMTQRRYLARMADNRRRMKDFGYRWLAISGSVRPGHRRLSNFQDGVVGCVLFLLAIAVVAGAAVSWGW